MCHQKCLDSYLHKKALERFKVMPENLDEELPGPSNEFLPRLSKRKKDGVGKNYC